MDNLKLENYETRRGKSRHLEVKIKCENCNVEKWVRWIRIKNGQGRFCGLKCANIAQRKWGKEHVKFYWDNGRGCWYAHWVEDGKQKSTTKARWLWEEKYGELTSKDVVTYIDGNSKNCELDNLKVISRSESNVIHMQGHYVSEETKQKLSEAHAGKTLSEEHKLKIGNSVRKRWDEGEFDNIHVGRYNKKWRGGVENAYPKEFNNSLRENIKSRDKYSCRICNEKDFRFEIHHMDGDRKNNKSINLITLCVKCHHLIHDSNKVDDPQIMAFRSILYQDNL